MTYLVTAFLVSLISDILPFLTVLYNRFIEFFKSIQQQEQENLEVYPFYTSSIGDVDIGLNENKDIEFEEEVLRKFSSIQRVTSVDVQSIKNLDT